MEVFDKRMSEILLPKAIRRSLRPLGERKFYHANQWGALYQFAAIPLLYGVLELRYL